MKVIIKNIKEEFFNIVFPKRCFVCDDILSKEDFLAGVCLQCKKKLKIVGNISCIKCGKPIKNPDTSLCQDCKRSKHAFRQNKALYIYDGDIRKSMYRFKYSNRRFYAKAYALNWWELYGHWVRSKGIEAIVPVPIYREKLVDRGYNQSELLAQELSLISGLPFANIVERVKKTAPMKGLSDQERRKNLKNAFNFIGNDVKYNHILVVDDIYTTGSTLDGVAKELISNGVDCVYTMTICIGRGK